MWLRPTFGAATQLGLKPDSLAGRTSSPPCACIRRRPACTKMHRLAHTHADAKSPRAGNGAITVFTEEHAARPRARVLLLLAGKGFSKEPRLSTRGHRRRGFSSSTDCLRLVNRGPVGWSSRRRRCRYPGRRRPWLDWVWRRMCEIKHSERSAAAPQHSPPVGARHRHATTATPFCTRGRRRTPCVRGHVNAPMPVRAYTRRRAGPLRLRGNVSCRI